MAWLRGVAVEAWLCGSDDGLGVLGFYDHPAQVRIVNGKASDGIADALKEASPRTRRAPRARGRSMTR